MGGMDTPHYWIVGAGLVFDPGDTEAFPGNLPVSAGGDAIGCWFCGLDYGID